MDNDHKGERPYIYINGFSINIGPADCRIGLMLDGTTTTDIRMSYTTAKTLAMKLAEATQYLDSKLEHPIYTIDDIKKRIIKEGTDGDQNH